MGDLKGKGVEGTVADGDLGKGRGDFSPKILTDPLGITAAAPRVASTTPVPAPAPAAAPIAAPLPPPASAPIAAPTPLPIPIFSASFNFVPLPSRSMGLVEIFRPPPAPSSCPT